MSCIHLHLGQAGNQIGKAFWRLAEEEFVEVDGVGGGVGGGRGSGASAATKRTIDARRDASNTRLLRPGGAAMFHEDGWARCLAVDSEPKVRKAIALTPGVLVGTEAVVVVAMATKIFCTHELAQRKMFVGHVRP